MRRLNPLLVILALAVASWIIVLSSTKTDDRIDASERQSMRQVLENLEREVTTQTTAKKTEDDSPCSFEMDVDFGDSSAEGDMVEDSSADECCAACVARDWCVAAVLSAATDTPAKACWLKPSIGLRIAKPGVVACIPKEEKPIIQSAKCRYEANVDVASGDRDEPIATDVSRERCCELCERDELCKTAVLSSDLDSPPRACWLKNSPGPLVKKAGVIACVPQTAVADFDLALKSPTLQGNNNVGGGKPQSFLEYSITAGEQQPKLTSSELESRRSTIRGAVLHAWKGYASKAWGADNVSPVSGKAVSAGFDMAVTLVDALDTLKLVGLDDEFAKARAYIASSDFKEKIRAATRRGTASFFETNIRVLGGLLGAHAVSENEDEGRPFLEAAVILGDAMYAKLDPETGGAPSSLAGRSNLRSGCPSLAHSGTTQLEFLYLSSATGDPKYGQRVLKFYETIAKMPNLDGLYPTCVGAPNGKLTMGAEADSFYEYLVKVWLFTGKRHDNVWTLYETSMESLDKKLVSRQDKASGTGFLFVDELLWRGGSAFSRDLAMEHLACFLPGTIALGAQHRTDTGHHYALADEIAETCHAFYDQTPTKIGPERVKKHDFSLRQTDTREYILRPEAAEGWWYLAELASLDSSLPVDKYRNWGWDAFTACDHHLKVAHGHASLRDVTKPQSGHIDKMESFWLAVSSSFFLT